MVNRRQFVTGALSLGAFGALGAAAAVPAQAATTLDPSNFSLTRFASSSSVLSGLDAALPKATLGTVLDDANRTLSPGPLRPGETTSLVFQDDDNVNTAWFPQGITTTADAFGSGEYAGRTAAMVSWYDSDGAAPQKGARVSMIDLPTQTYRHVLLVEPTTDSAGKPSFKAIPIHAGGMFWYGDLVYVADSRSARPGLVVFDLRRMYEVDLLGGGVVGRQSDGRYGAYNYTYVLVQIGRYDIKSAGGQTAVRVSSTALDRTSTPDSITIHEYRQGEVDAGQKVRVLRFPIDYSTRHLADVGATRKATEAYDLDINGFQGSVAIDGSFYFADSDGVDDTEDAHGDMYRFDPPAEPVRIGNTLPQGVEDLSYWAATDEVWTVAEHPGRRRVVAMSMDTFR